MSNRYHFEGSLPQYDVVCKERLVRPEDPANSSAQLALQVAAQVSGKCNTRLPRFGQTITAAEAIMNPFMQHDRTYFNGPETSR